MGVEFNCPSHPPEGDTDHRLRLWFANPTDGDEHIALDELEAEMYPRLLYRTGHRLENITLTPVGGHAGDVISVPGHWKGYVLEGEVFDSVTLPAW
jgi:hypothetical protein